LVKNRQDRMFLTSKVHLERKFVYTTHQCIFAVRLKENPYLNVQYSGVLLHYRTISIKHDNYQITLQIFL
jgi:hypothetical protein